ncbi:MAG: DUF3365 domain-containing protein [Campylobacterota bacterium]|nr:DUF3365 domain-containing protein [Campylobacterota bacterium]
MNILKHITYITLSSCILFAAPSTKKEAEIESVLKNGKRGSALLLKTLGKNMKQKMKNGGLNKALDFCSNEAYTLTEKVNRQLPKGVRVKRISNKFRSPANKPSEQEAAILKSFADMKALNLILPNYLVEQVDTHKYKYYKPLLINKKVCLKCHGTLKDIELKREIASRYPLDNALGYKMGDLRGAVVVTVDKSVK